MASASPSILSSSSLLWVFVFISTESPNNATIAMRGAPKYYDKTKKDRNVKHHKY
jgi:hypothetical protein